MKINTLVTLAALLLTASGKPEEEKVTHLPQIGKLPFEMYSGYIDLPKTSKKIHYVLVESEQNPKKDPLIIWFNGGPGCSSMLAFLQENGPYTMKDGSSKLEKSDYSWNREANVLYIEQPAGVGYSYCDQRAGEECQFNDDKVADDNLQVVLRWYEKYPEFKTNDLYLSGESYAGIYVPYLLNEIHLHNQKAGSSFKPPLMGMMVGNGVTNWKYDMYPSYIETAYWHSILSQESYDKMKKYDCDYSGIYFGKWGSTRCFLLLYSFIQDVKHVNLYDIHGKCWGNGGKDEAALALFQEGDMGIKSIDGLLKTYKKAYTHSDYTPWMLSEEEMAQSLASMGVAAPQKKTPGVPPCIFGGPVTDYLNEKDVRDALHIPAQIQGWQMCFKGIKYHRQPKGSQWVWEDLKGKYRMLKFSGDLDGAVATTGTINWINSLNRTVTEKWRAYYVDDHIGGYVQGFDGLTLGTIRGAGHMAPQTNPAETYHLVFSWLRGDKI